MPTKIPIEIYQIVILCAITLATYVSAINARGTAKIIASYLFASFILLASVYLILTYISGEKIAAKESEMVKYEEQLKIAEQEAQLAAEQKAENEMEKKYKAELIGAINKGSKIARAILSIDVEDEDIDDDRLRGRSLGLRRQANDLKKNFNKIKPPEDSNIFSAEKKEIQKAIRSLNVGAYYFNLYFKAEDEDEEDEFYDIYRGNAGAARTKFSRVMDKLAAR
jgi:hypothetical protein